MIDLSSYEKAFMHLPEGASAAEVNAECLEETTVRIAQGHMAGSESFSRTKLYVRATGQKTGMVYTEKLDEDASEVIGRALENAKYATGDKPEPMQGARKERIPCETSMESIADMIAFGIAAERALKSGRTTALSVTLRRRTMRTLNSLGLDVESGTYSANATMGVLLQRERGVAEGEAYLSAPCLRQMDPQMLADKAFAEADAMDGGGLPCVTIQSGTYPCVISGQVMRNLLMTAWQSFAADYILRGASSIKAVGERVGSPVFHVTNAPCHPLVGDRWITDSEGVPVAVTQLVKNGMLTSPLYTLSSAEAAGARSTGAAGRVPRMTGDVPIALATVPALVYVEPGTDSRDALIERMGDGLLITYSLDLYHSVNVASGAFSVPCGGVLYEKGKPVGAVSQVTMAGDLKEFWHHIVAVADDLDFSPFYFHTYDVGSPSVLADKIILAS